MGSGTVVTPQEWVSQIEAGLFQLLPDEELVMVGAQVAIAASFVMHETNVLVMREG